MDGPHRGRRGARLALADVEVGMQVGLVRVHPPGIDADRVQLLVDLAPVDLARFLGIRIVERRRVAGADPVLLADLDVALVDVALGVELLEVGGVRIELRPHRDHDLRVLRVDVVDHALRIGETRLVEIVRAPGVLRPVRPVHARCCRAAACACGIRPARRSVRPGSCSARGSARSRRPISAAAPPCRSAAGSRR